MLDRQLLDSSQIATALRWRRSCTSPKAYRAALRPSIVSVAAGSILVMGHRHLIPAVTPFVLYEEFIFRSSRRAGAGFLPGRPAGALPRHLAFRPGSLQRLQALRSQPAAAAEVAAPSASTA